MTQPEPGRTRSLGGAAGRTVLALASIFVALTAGWFEAKALFRLIGEPDPLVEYLLAVVLAALTAGIVLTVVSRLLGRDLDGGRAMFADTLAALDRIAQGDFDVHITSDGRGPYAEVVESVNKMARDLGTLEQQRQDFVSNVSHEIQSPLTSIGGFTGLLRDPGLDEPTRQHYLDIISAECRRLSGLSDNLLRLSALDDTVLNRTRIRLDEQLRDVILALEPQWSERELTVQLDAIAVTVEADADLLRQVWTNLVQNAVKFTPSGGRIRVTVRAQDSAGIVEVTDTGVGIASVDLPHVFERFYRVDKARGIGGNGLGLALAKRIVDLHAGRITVASTPGQGTTFTVQLR
ncbi:MAG: ATP-binding protein [Propionicimonas sp.]